MELFMCADGGGSKARILIFAKNGDILADVNSPQGVNANFMPPDAAFDSMMAGVSSALKSAGVTVTDISAFGIFSPGVHHYEERLKAALAPIPIEVLGDRFNAFWGALSAPPGIVILSGTGSFVFGIDGRKTEIMAGGWGSVFGDGGSGYSMGAAALRAATRRHDSGDPPGTLTRLILEERGFSNVEDLRHGMNGPHIGRKDIASLCPTIKKAADLGDADALEIIDTAAAELAFQTGQVYRRFGNPRWNYTFTGGISNMGDAILTPLKAHVAALCPNLRYIPPQFPPHIGAVLYMLYDRGVAPADIINNIKRGVSC